MLRFKRRSVAKTGLPPGTMMHVGDKKVRHTTITVMHYDEAGMEEREVASVEECELFERRPGVTWINVEGVEEVEVIEKIGARFALHPLLLEDVVNTEQRIKTEEFDGHIFSVVKMISYDEQEQAVHAEQVSLVLGDGIVISFQEAQGDVFDRIRERIRKGSGRIRRMGADYLTYALLDNIVDEYFVVLEKLGDRIEQLQEELMDNPSSELLQELHELRQEMIFLRRTVWPLRELIGGLAHSDSELIHEATVTYLRDMQDHAFQVIETIEAFRDTLASMMDIYLSSVSNRMNAIMKVLTIIATIFIPLTFIAGVYGMNFQRMPELAWPWGYPMALGAMGAVAVVMLLYFRSKRWL